ncbi:MAG: phosphoribosylglycinamide formyltransferase [Candidatus Nanopelagicales bacterium]
MNKPKIVVMASGEGSLLQALLDQQKNLNYEVGMVLSDKKEARALARAQAATVPTQLLEPKNFESIDAWHFEILRTIQAANPALIVLAGFMRILPELIVLEFQNKILNSHPSLLPLFPGLNAVAQALAENVQETGATMHLVDQGVDTGPIVHQVTVKVLPQDTPEALHQRIKLAEQEALPKVVDLLVNNQWQVVGGKVVIDY